MHIFTDSISKVSISNNNIRVVLSQNGPEHMQMEIGTLIIPANQAGNFVNSLAGGLKQLDEKLKAKVETDADGKSNVQ